MEQTISRRNFMVAAAAATAAAPLALGALGAAPEARAEDATTRSYPWSPGFENLEAERSYDVEVEGNVPAALNGTLFRNGPGINKIAGQWLAHWFDGDGMLSAIRFTGGGVHYQNRYVMTPKHINETSAGKVLYRGFGTMKPGGVFTNALRVPENASNTSVVYHADKLLSLWEGGFTYRINPADLSTVGPDDFDGQVPVFSAHPKIDPRTGELFNFGMIYGRTNQVQIYRITRDGKLDRFPAIEMPWSVMNHDFVITEKYLVFCFNPIMFNGIKMILGFGSFDGELSWNGNRPTRILMVPRNRASQPRWIDAEPFFQFHFANAYDDGGSVVVDVARYPDYSTAGEEVRNFWKTGWPSRGGAQMTRLTIDPSGGKTESRALADREATEFPRIDPRRNGNAYRFLYVAAAAPGATRGFQQTIARVDTTTGEISSHDFAPNGYVGEPVFIPAAAKGAEDDGYVVTLVLNAATKRTDIVILDARDIAAKPLAVAHLTHHVPFGFHGFFTDRTFT
ncbi:MAG: carotenoid oxygenase family protein [Candidatus Binataceae bacterium]